MSEPQPVSEPRPGPRHAPAKVNLLLRVGPRRADGYHAVDTILLALGLADEISFSAADTPGLEVRGDTTVPAGEDNLCWRAQRLFGDRVPAAGAKPQRIHLQKRIPAGAGLGGGSSDAAAVLLALNEAFGEPLTAKQLAGLGAELGSDVPFFLSGSVLAAGSDRGQEVEPLPAPPPRPVLVLVPGFGIATADAYGWLDEDRGPDPAPRATAGVAPDPRTALADWEHLAALAANDFEAPVFRRHPILELGKSHLLDAGASVALLCGSGSCLFGVFESSGARDQAAHRIPATASGEPAFRAILTHTRDPSEPG
ncbi:MAG: 4-(cytidine 5'-diphospho)-2-C-methyl-D-erythritol kinase [Gemmatimonadota bacterium]